MPSASAPPRPGFCPYCGYDNPPEYRFCVSCRRRLPDVVHKPGVPQAGVPSASTVEQPEAPSPSVEAQDVGAGPAPPSGRPWFLIPVAIVIVVIVALAALEFFPAYLGVHPSSSGPPPASGHRVDLCVPDNGSNCKGFSFSVPFIATSQTMNATGCDPIASLGPSELAWLNYTAAGSIDAIVLPAAFFVGSTGWTYSAFAMVQNQSLLDRALWFSHLASGQFTESIQVPANSGTYCLGWWEPAGTPVSVTWLDDLNITYQ